tara:strand:+ start:412 stop:564 length:153 start_codon:yes stop_codon:yes gene_type:complete
VVEDKKTKIITIIFKEEIIASTLLSEIDIDKIKYIITNPKISIDLLSIDR